jgi:aryl-alcohol dehydrogenase-like predicted oxidoreductase
MQYTSLGRTGLKVSRLCLGTMNFGPFTPENEAHALMDHAHALGINFFDTADVYGRVKGEGVTEQIIGRWFAGEGNGGGQRRERTVIATKVYGEMGEWPNTSKHSVLHIRRACEASLRRLRTDHIDLYQMHHIDRETPVDEILQAFETLVTQGKVLYVGSSNYAGWHIARFNELAKQRHFLGLVSEQCKYSLLDRMVETEILPACEAYGLGVIPWSPLAGGLLGGVLQGPKEGRRAGILEKDSFKQNRQKIERWEALCKELGQPPAVVALGWTLHNRTVTAPIIGPRTIQQLDESIAATELKLSEETLRKLDEIFPPFKPSPEHFAW